MHVNNIPFSSCNAFLMHKKPSSHQSTPGGVPPRQCRNSEHHLEKNARQRDTFDCNPNDRLQSQMQHPNAAVLKRAQVPSKSVRVFPQFPPSRHHESGDRAEDAAQVWGQRPQEPQSHPQNLVQKVSIQNYAKNESGGHTHFQLDCPQITCTCLAWIVAQVIVVTLR